MNLFYTPMFANALSFAFDKATTEGKITITLLVLVSLFSWTVIITKTRQLRRAHRASREFYAAFNELRGDPMQIHTKQMEFNGSPAFEVYYAGAEELAYHLKNNPVEVKARPAGNIPAAGEGNTDFFAKSIVTKVSSTSFDSVRASLQRAVSSEALSLEKGMIVLTTAVAGGPFIGLLGTVWGVMETFSGIAIAKSASLTVMAPGVAGALIATVVGLFVAIPAMFAYNLMVTAIRAITQELDNFTTELATKFEHAYVDHRSLADELADALETVRQRQGDKVVQLS